MQCHPTRRRVTHNLSYFDVSPPEFLGLWYLKLDSCSI